MNQKLSEMSLAELWQLFPIFLTKHQAFWFCWYQEEQTLLKKILSPFPTACISHIGSTAIPGIWAKPIIDILVEMPPDFSLKQLQELFISHGYICMSETKHQNRISFVKGYTENGFAERVFHLHLRHLGDHDELYFRDYLINHPDVAKKYETLKLSLWKQFEHDRDAYTASKTDFVKKYTDIAKKIYNAPKI